MSACVSDDRSPFGFHVSGVPNIDMTSISASHNLKFSFFCKSSCIREGVSSTSVKASIQQVKQSKSLKPAHRVVFLALLYVTCCFSACKGLVGIKYEPCTLPWALKKTPKTNLFELQETDGLFYVTLLYYIIY